MLFSTQATEILVLRWPRRVVLILFSLDFLLVLLSFVATLLMKEFGLGRIYGSIFRFFDIDQEGNLPSWYSSTKLFCLAVLFSILAWKKFKDRSSVSWMLCFLSGIFLVFSIDEATEVHERTSRLIEVLVPGNVYSNTGFKVSDFWVLFVGAIVLFSLVSIFVKLKPYFSKNPKILHKCVMGLLIFMGGAVVLDTLVHLIPLSQGNLLALTGHAEEFFEMAGITIMIWAMIDLLQSYNFKIVFDENTHAVEDND